MSENIQKVRVGKRGEIVIPAEIREQLGLEYGSELFILVDSGAGYNLRLIPKSYQSFSAKWGVLRERGSKKSANKVSIDLSDSSDHDREKFLENILNSKPLKKKKSKKD